LPPSSPSPAQKPSPQNSSPVKPGAMNMKMP
jgi:hypothetical protein